MWSAVAPDDVKVAAPSARAKHSATLVGEHVYLLGGRNGNLPMKDFWKYHLVTGKWTQIKPVGDKLPCLQEHTAVSYRDYIYVFGGEVGFSAGTETPLWVYDIKANIWRKKRTKKGVATPKGRRGHTALVHNGSMLVYGGYQDLRGSCSELWAYHFEFITGDLATAIVEVPTEAGKRQVVIASAYFPGDSRTHPPPEEVQSLIRWCKRGNRYLILCCDANAHHLTWGSTDTNARDTESWHLVSTSPAKIGDQYPPPRHKHSAVLHGDAMWIYGGMTDLQERSDLWKWDVASRTWHSVKNKINPGPLHSHAACKLPSGMVVFGGERSGQTCNDLWRFSFTFETWEKLNINGLKPQPRAESTAITIPELLLNGSSNISMEQKSAKMRTRICTSADRGNRHSSYLPNNKVAPCETTYVFHPSQSNYNDGSDLAQQYSDPNRSRSFLQEISKLSQNIPKISNKCSYTVLTGCAGDSTESLLKQHSSPQEAEVIDTELSTPSRGTMVKSKSAYAIKKKYNLDPSPTEEGESKQAATKKRVEFDSTALKIPREPISVPNFSVLTLPTPVLTPVEASKLVYLDSEEENELLEKDLKLTEAIRENNEKNVYENFKPVKRGESYSSHLGYADNPLYQQMITSLQENSEENVSSTSDYASIETVNRLSSASSYSVKTGTPLDENQRNKEKDKSGPFGFCNPNYMGPDIKSILHDKANKKNAVKILAKEDPVRLSDGEESLELQNFNGVINKNTTVLYRHSSRVTRPPKSLPLEKNPHQHRVSIEKHRALSASRVERHSRVDKSKQETTVVQSVDPSLALYVYVFGGKEQGHVTVFQRPISIWRLKLF